MATLILILNSDEIISHPCVYVHKDGKYTGSSVSLGFDKSEDRALRIARELIEDSYPSAQIVNLYNFRPTQSQLSEYLSALHEYYGSWIEHERYNQAAPELMHKCAVIKSTFKIAGATKPAPIDPFDQSPNTQYALARHIGDSRFGSECQHERTAGGRCLDCQRQVR